MPPPSASGTISYLEIPAVDVDRSADFHEASFGWHIRRRGNGDLAFDDASGNVSGTWGHRPPAVVAAWAVALHQGRER